MNWDTRRNPIETLVEWAAPAVLAAAVGWSAWTMTGNPAITACSLTAVMTLGVVLLGGVAADARISPADFEPLPFEDAAADELLLDDPLVPIGEGSRVVRLFDKQPRTPGEMITRISDYLEVKPKGRHLAAAAGEPPPPRRPSDASLALHEALASIRASLR